MLVEEPLQLKAGLEHVNGVAARPAARATGAKSANGKRALEIDEDIVAQVFRPRERRAKRGKRMLLFHTKNNSSSYRRGRYSIMTLS